MNCVSCDIGLCVYQGCLYFFPGVFLGSRVTGACPVTTDLIMRVNVRTTTTTPAQKKSDKYVNIYCVKNEQKNTNKKIPEMDRGDAVW